MWNIPSFREKLDWGPTEWDAQFLAFSAFPGIVKEVCGIMEAFSSVIEAITRTRHSRTRRDLYFWPLRSPLRVTSQASTWDSIPTTLRSPRYRTHEVHEIPLPNPIRSIQAVIHPCLASVLNKEVVDIMDKASIVRQVNNITLFSRSHETA